ncbi:hypothetical protein AAFN47_16265 [Hoeflea sp. CAU 1731]
MVRTLTLEMVYAGNETISGALKLMSKRTIDIRREAAGQMQVGTLEEGSITGLVEFGDRFLIVKEKAVYEFIMADKIDPDRNNERIPNSQQRIFKVGSNDPVIGHTLLTADTLFNPKFLPDTFDREKAMDAALRLTNDLVAMRDEQRKLLKEIEIDVADAATKPFNSGFAIPAIMDLEPRCKTVVQRADHITIAVLDIARLFFGSQITHADSLSKFAESEFEEEDQFRIFSEQAVPLLRLIRESRNAVEHHKPAKRAVFANFQMNSEGKLVRPQFELIHPQFPQPTTDLVEFFGYLIEELSTLFETFVALCCGYYAQFDKFIIAVVSQDKARRRSPHVRYSYALAINGEWAPLS